MSGVASSDEAIRLLKEGNRRFVSGKLLHPNTSIAHRKEILSGQEPFAAILSCSDSRVIAPFVFDAGIGDLFLVKNAGNIANGVSIGSLEYAAGHLKVPLIIVLGHTKCGAVTAAAQGYTKTGAELDKCIDRIMPSVKRARKMAGDLIMNSVIENVRTGVAKLKENKVLRGLVEAKRLRIIGAIYLLETGVVEFL